MSLLIQKWAWTLQVLSPGQGLLCPTRPPPARPLLVLELLEGQLEALELRRPLPSPGEGCRLRAETATTAAWKSWRKRGTTESTDSSNESITTTGPLLMVELMLGSDKVIFGRFVIFPLCVSVSLVGSFVCLFCSVIDCCALIGLSYWLSWRRRRRRKTGTTLSYRISPRGSTVCRLLKT